jgi:hypothetical protein
MLVSDGDQRGVFGLPPAPVRYSFWGSEKTLRRNNYKDPGPRNAATRKYVSNMIALLNRLMHRCCPSCGCVELRRSARKNFFETALLPPLLTRPAKTAVIAFTVWRSEEEFRLPTMRSQFRTSQRTYRFWSTDAGRTKSLFRKRQISVC